MDYTTAKQRIFEIVVKRILKDTRIDLDMLEHEPNNFERIIKDDIFNVGLAARIITREIMEWSPIEEEDE